MKETLESDIINIFFLYIDCDPESRNALTVYITNQEFINHNMDDFLERESFNEIIQRYAIVFYRKFTKLYSKNASLNNYHRYLIAITKNQILPDRYSEKFRNFLESAEFKDFLDKK